MIILKDVAVEKIKVALKEYYVSSEDSEYNSYAERLAIVVETVIDLAEEFEPGPVVPISLTDTTIGNIPNDEKEKKAKPKKEIDADKILALHNAGWPAAKIADEVKCGKTTVYRIIDERKADIK